MTTLKFADTHNMVAFLAKPAESEGFDQIVDFLNAHTIKYALTVNPTIYTSCIEQFWATVKAKTVNGEVQLQALVDGKKIIITESIVRRDLQLEDAIGVDCLPNSTIFEQLTLMGYEKISQKLTFYKAFFSPQWKFFIHTILQCLSSKTTAWNEFSSTMASAIIYLATNQKFNFSKYIFEIMVKNLDNVSRNFLMYPGFVQVFVNQQLEGMPTHKRIYIAPSHTKKIFGNMRRVGKGFSGRETPLFQTMVVQDQAEMGEGSSIHTDPHHAPTFIQPLTSQPQMKQRLKGPKIKDTQVPQPSSPTTNVADEAVNEEMDASLESGEDRLKLEELMALCITLQSRVLALETTKTTQATEIASLKKRVKKLDRRNKSRTHGLKRLYRVGSSRRVESSEDKGLDMFGVNDLDSDEVVFESVDVVNTAKEIRSVVEEVNTVTIPISAAITTTTTTAITDVEMTLAQTLAELKSAKPKATTITTTPTLTTTTVATTITAVSTRPKVKGLVIHKQEQAPTPTVSSKQPSQVKVQDKGKGKMVEPEPVKKMSKKELLRLDEELAFKLQAEEEEEEEERLAREKAQQVEEANIAWDDVQAKIEADYQLAQRLQAQEQEELTDEEKARLFVQFLEQRRKHFAAKRAEEKRNRPPTRAQQRSIMCTYLKNMEGWKPKSLKNKSFANIQELFDKAMKRVNTFVDYRTELVEESSKKAEAEIAHESSLKRAGEELEQESSKKQKLEEDKESEELKQCLEIIPDDGDDVTIDATPLSTKSPTIMLKNFDKEDLEVLWSIVKARFKKTEPVNYMDNFLLLNLKTMFEHHVKDNVWKNQQGLVKVLNWKLYDSCGVHCVTMQNMLFYMLVKKIYPLTNHTLHQLFNDVKLQVNYECEMAFELLKLVKK
ncbi:hypothetical protein Tco_0001124 [Tanacetum coccineum]